MNQQLRIQGSVEEVVLQYAALAKEAGLHGVVCSPKEAAAIKSRLGKEFLAVTPGVRPMGSETGDQKRISTPAEAIKAGSDYLVIGRPITQSSDPQRVFNEILSEIEGAMTREELLTLFEKVWELCRPVISNSHQGFILPNTYSVLPSLSNRSAAGKIVKQLVGQLPKGVDTVIAPSILAGST